MKNIFANKSERVRYRSLSLTVIRILYFVFSNAVSSADHKSTNWNALSELRYTFSPGLFK